MPHAVSSPIASPLSASPLSASPLLQFNQQLHLLPPEPEPDCLPAVDPGSTDRTSTDHTSTDHTSTDPDSIDPGSTDRTSIQGSEPAIACSAINESTISDPTGQIHPKIAHGLGDEPDDFADLTPSDALLEQTRRLFKHSGSNAELMSQVMQAIEALHPIYD
ncbi:MAG: hypothetical protein MUF72_23600 [Elainella sp. Prado103]|nr:hypothetical protein [Elainella sp. Prado103]